MFQDLAVIPSHRSRVMENLFHSATVEQENTNWNSIAPRNSRNKIYDRKLSSNRCQDSNKIGIGGGPSGNSRSNISGAGKAERLHPQFIIIKPRESWSKLYDRSFGFMQWVEPEKSSLVDAISRVPFSHITLLCKNMICATCECTDCATYSHSQILTIHMISEMSDNVFMLSGSHSEGCPLPPYVVESEGANVTEESDIDIMVREAYAWTSVYLVGFHRSDGSDIKAVIETTQTHPGYLLLREMDGTYKQNKSSSGEIPRMMETLPTEYSALEVTPSYCRHGPSVEINMTDSGHHVKFDFVRHYPCASWPPEAEPWKGRHRPSNWPARETIERIVSTGCSVVPKPHPPQPSF